MKLQWIEDLIAIAEARSITEAAARRHVTQPAFSRRILAIEEHLGMAVVDRTRRPARPTRAVVDAAAAFHEIASRLRQLPGHLTGSARVVIACQHTLSVSIAPELVRRVLQRQPDTIVRLRSGNRDECLALLMTQQAHMMVAFETDDLPIVSGDHFIEKHELSREALIPVIAPGSPIVRWRDDPHGELPIVFYPDDVFLGMVMSRTVLPSVVAQVRLRRVVETALTLAGREIARTGLGVAWLPESLVRQDLADGRLTVLPGEFTPCVMSLVVLRRKDSRSEAEEKVWRAATAQDGADAAFSPPCAETVAGR
ncbi:LysR substrate-binding domain-containing protein [Geminicoccaceae bacterium 1502E]|nr:LysR substrate-binding domain-containing protein [Geminicoccaceae bacterium 1502E]